MYLYSLFVLLVVVDLVWGVRRSYSTLACCYIVIIVIREGYFSLFVAIELTMMTLVAVKR